MGTISRPSDSSSGGIETTAFIQCINGLEPQIRKFWCQDLDRICREFNTNARVDIPDGTIREFVTEYLAENGHQIRITRELSVNKTVQFLGLSDQVWGNGLPYISNPWGQVEATWWGSFNN